ncbi:MAG: APC family permease [Dehalococcoidia bacterium]|jgi:amino acid transporter
MNKENHPDLPDGGKKPSGESGKPESPSKKIRPDLIVTNEVKRGINSGNVYIRKAGSTINTGVSKLGRLLLVIKKVNRKLKKLLPGSQVGKVESSTTEPSKASDETKAQTKEIRPDLVVSEVKKGGRVGNTYVRTRQSHPQYFRKVGPAHFVATPESDQPAGLFARIYKVLKRIVIGRPMETARDAQERLSKFKALAIFGSDAISSSAYATEAALVILVSAGNSALDTSLYISIAIVVLLAIVSFSYRQIIYAYPGGGGSYVVSRENLGEIPGLAASAALMIDYILMVSVSIVAGTEAITSALVASGSSFGQGLPDAFNLNVILSLLFIALLTFGNLRGLRESGTIFAMPTYLFIVSFGVMLVVGLIKVSNGTLQPATVPPVVETAAPALTLWLILRAFSAGSVAMSGTEAISNGVTAFQKPEARNAAKTLIVMAIVLGIAFLGVSYLATNMELVPGEETIISQVAHAVFGVNAFYVIFQIATMGILVIAANTAFAVFPRLSSVMAHDHYMPHQFMDKGDRLAYSTGIIALGGIAALLVVVFQGNVNKLIHLYAVGVFLAFCLANSGMVVHWWKKRGYRWKSSIIVNGLGAVVTTVILVIVIVTKFMFGAWIVILLIPLLIIFFRMVHRHYVNVGEQLRIVSDQLPSPKIDQVVIVPIEDINYASLRAIAFARTIASDAIMLHVSTDPESAEKVRQRVNSYASDLKLVVVESPFRSFVRPLLAYVKAIHSQKPDAFVTIILPEFITAHWWERYLHERSALRLHKVFEKHPNIAVVMVPYLLEK